MIIIDRDLTSNVYIKYFYNFLISDCIYYAHLASVAPAAAAAVPALSLHVFVPVHDASAPHLHTPDKHRLANILVLTAAWHVASVLH